MKRQQSGLYGWKDIYSKQPEDIRADPTRKQNYEPADIEHIGQQRILELIKRNYQQQKIRNDIKKYIQGCQKCQQNKVQYMKKAE